MLKKLFVLSVVMVFSLQATYAQYEQEARIFIDEIIPKQMPPHTKETLDNRVNELAIFANSDETTSLKAMQKIYEEHSDRGLKDYDPIQHELEKQPLELPSQNIAQDTENLLNQRRRWHINENDSIIFSQNIKSENSKIITCREGAKGIERSCIRKTFYSTETDVKTLKFSVSGSLSKGALLGIDLKTGIVSILDANDFAGFDYKCFNSIDLYFAFSTLLTYCPDLMIPTHLSSITNGLLDIGSAQDIRIEKNVLIKHDNSYAYINYTLLEEPSQSNDYIAKIALISLEYHDANNALHHFGFDVSWGVKLPLTIKQTEEGCEWLINHSQCKEISSQILTKKENEIIAEQKQFICRQGTKTNECAAIDVNQCEQIATRCVLAKDKQCIEFEQTFSCGKKISQNTKISSEDIIKNFISQQNKVLISESYDAAEFGNALTQLSAIKSMNAPMEDNLGGIIGDPNNPSIFRGECKRCTVTLGDVFNDCCQLKGIAQGLLGGCREEEKQLAVAEVKDKRCIKVGKKYCVHKVLGKCVEKKEAYCCYGSQLAKIIQEIAHEQLHIPWGDGKNPQCSSLTAEQLSYLSFDTSFAKAKLSQLFDDYQTTAQNTFNSTQGKAEALQKDLENRFYTKND